MWSDKDDNQLSFGTDWVSAPDRYRVHNPYPRDWNLEIINVRTEDDGTYKCHITTQPPVMKTVRLIVAGDITESV